MSSNFSCLVLPNDPLSVYAKQGNLHQFLERLDYYCKHLGQVYVLNVDKKKVAWSGKTIVINQGATGFKPLDLLLQFLYSYHYGFGLKVGFLRSFESCTFLKSGLLGVVSALLGKKFVVSIHGTYKGNSEVMGFNPIHTTIFSFFKFLTKNTADLSFVIDQMYVDELKWENQFVVPNFVDTKLFKPSNDAKVWDGVFVGSLTTRKGLPYLVKAIQSVRTFIPTAKFAVIGFGELQGLVKDQPGIDYLGSLPHDLLPLYYNKARFFCTATLHEGFCIPVAEAQACGIPVVATDLPPFHNNTVVGETSLLSEVGDVPAMVGNMLYFLENPEEAVEMGVKARAFVEKRFQKEALLDQEIELIKTAVNR